ncbi:MAG TPA: hypothetical protein VL137_00140 [Polyangiaceae bacterium]|jgi:hypothetical protein|nr:hypothetical protein [Polyangiaceae bacterium]
MLAHKARVENGRLKLDEPTDLPEGAELELVPLDDGMTDEQRAEAMEGIREGLAQVLAGQSIDADEVLAEILAD